MPKNNDVVRLRQAIPSESLPEGAIGTIVAEFTKPNEAYEVEFCDSNGRTINQLALTPDQFDVVNEGPWD
jgi:hypothetical protein